MVKNGSLPMKLFTASPTISVPKVFLREFPSPGSSFGFSDV
jgi:hypothetical protein